MFYQRSVAQAVPRQRHERSIVPQKQQLPGAYVRVYSLVALLPENARWWRKGATAKLLGTKWKTIRGVRLPAGLGSADGVVKVD